jgi:polyadenylate-binding protein
MWSQRDPSLRRTGSGNIFIKNLDKAIDHKMIYDTFASFGNILSCKVATDESGNSKGYAFVHYETSEAAQEAINKTNGKLLNGKKIFVGLFVAKKERQASQEAAPKWTNIFVKNIPKSIDTEAKLQGLFEKFGKITSSVLVKEEVAQESKGFGFLNFDSHEEAKAAVDEMNGKEIDGQQLYVGKAQKKSERERELKDMFEKLKRERMSKYQGVNLYVKNLEDNVDDAKLRQEFATCGTITSAKVMIDDKGVSKGFGFVCFATPDEATKAVTEMNGKMMGNKPIYVALAQRKDQRQAQLQAQHQRSAGVRMQQPGMAAMYPPGAMFYAPNMMRGAPYVYPGGGRGAPFMAPQRGGYPNQGVPGYRVQPGGQAKGRPVQKGQVPYPGIKVLPTARNLQAEQPQSAEERRQFFGEQLFPRIIETLKERAQPEDLAGKITGMFLELEPADLEDLLTNNDSLNKKVSEALEVLATSQQ